MSERQAAYFRRLSPPRVQSASRSSRYSIAMADTKNPEIWKAVSMLDHFDKIQRLPNPVDGVPNFRRVPGYKVYCCGQPTKKGFENAIEKVCGDKYPKTGAIIWINMRQEPNVYINGNPVCARPPNKIGEYAELGAVTSKCLLWLGTIWNLDLTELKALFCF